MISVGSKPEASNGGPAKLESLQTTVALESIHERLFKILEPPPRYNVCEWADDRRYLSKESASQSGKYRSSFAPFQRAPMEDATDGTVESVTLMWSSQIGKSTILENVTGFFIDIDPAPILMVQPTVELAQSFSKERLAPMVRDTPCLKDKVKDSKSRESGNTIAMKSFPGGNIAMVGANAPSGLAGRPRRVVLLDEVDRMPASAGTEGDPCALAEKRTETFWNAVIYRTSTPTLKGFSRIEKSYELSDKRRWFCPCPMCGHHQVLKWSQVLWGRSRVESLKLRGVALSKEDEAPPDDGSDAIYECEAETCRAHLNDAQRVVMVRSGEWRATAPFAGKRGYHLNGINSPFKSKRGFKNRLHQMVSGFREAKKGGRETLKVWVNTFLAETWEDEGDRVEYGPLLKRGEGYSTNNLPEGIILVAAAVDVQADRVVVESIGLGEGDETWGIEFVTLIGNTEQDDVWQDLSDHLSRKYERDDGVILPIICTAIDMRHKPHKIKKFVKTCGLPRVYPVYGVGGTNPVLVTDRWNKRDLIRTYSVSGMIAKDTIYARLRITEPGERYMHFPKGHGYSQEFFEQLTAEVRKTKYVHGHPQPYYEKQRDRNEALDIRVYHLAAIDILKPNLTAIKKRLRPAEKSEGGNLKPEGDQSGSLAAPDQAKKTEGKQRKKLKLGGF